MLRTATLPLEVDDPHHSSEILGSSLSTSSMDIRSFIFSVASYISVLVPTSMPMVGPSSEYSRVFKPFANGLFACCYRFGNTRAIAGRLYLQVADDILRYFFRLEIDGAGQLPPYLEY